MPHRLPPPTPTTPTEELAAIRRCVNAIEALDTAARRRTVAWLADAYGNPEAVPAVEEN